jgi:uncharacterized protein (DUF433 family)
MSSLAILDRELYSLGEAARLLQLSPVTLKRWLEGATRKGVFYEPVLRAERSGSESVTWGEFVEAGLLSEYRRRGHRLQQMRPVIQRLREELGVPYPLAHGRPYSAGRDLVREIQDEQGLDPSLWVVVSDPKGQLTLAPEAERFFDRVEFDAADVARRMYPAGRESLVTIDPKKSFGIPTVRGVRTENVVELFRSGESVGAIADAFDLEIVEVEAALRFEAA